jgi:hypothetical protein
MAGNDLYYKIPKKSLLRPEFDGLGFYNIDPDA